VLASRAFAVPIPGNKRYLGESRSANASATLWASRSLGKSQPTAEGRCVAIDCHSGRCESHCKFLASWLLIASYSPGMSLNLGSSTRICCCELETSAL
jgi:hypothetical protein